MKLKFLLLLLNLLFITISFAQPKEANEDFIELGFRTSTFIESSFLNDTYYRGRLRDPSLFDQGIYASETGRNAGLTFRYGKKLSNRLHLISELGYIERQEQVVLFMHCCDVDSTPQTLALVKSVDIGTGIRLQLIRFGQLYLSLQSIFNFSVALNEPHIYYYGFNFSPLLGCTISERVDVFLKYGYERSFKKYKKQENMLELGMDYKF